MKKEYIRILNITYVLLCVIFSIILFIRLEWRGAIQSLVFSLITLLYYLVVNKFKVKINLLTLIFVYILAIGALLGSCFDFYTIFVWFDLFLHFLSGIIFTSLGIDIIIRLFDNESVSNKYSICLIFGIMFSLSIALLWELFEYVGSIVGFDMQEDSIINSFNSYLLSGTHLEVFNVDGITKTVVYYGENQVIEINGYLDLGLIDTIHDMIICLIGTICYAFFSICFKKYLDKKNINSI